MTESIKRKTTGELRKYLESKGYVFRGKYLPNRLWNIMTEKDKEIFIEWKVR